MPLKVGVKVSVAVGVQVDVGLAVDVDVIVGVVVGVNSQPALYSLSCGTRPKGCVALCHNRLTKAVLVNSKYSSTTGTCCPEVIAIAVLK